MKRAGSKLFSSIVAVRGKVFALNIHYLFMNQSNFPVKRFYNKRLIFEFDALLSHRQQTINILHTTTARMFRTKFALKDYSMITL